MAQFVNVQQKDLGAGIDRLSSETSIPEGYSEKLVNWEPTPEGYLKKRTGYETTNGRLPVRVHSFSGSKLTLDTGIDITKQAITPILIGGFNSDGTGPTYFSTSDYSIDPRVEFSETETEVISAVNSGLIDDKVSIQFIQADDGATYQEVVYPDEVTVNTTNYEVSVTVTEGLPSTLKGYLAFKERGILGESYVSGSFNVTANTIYSIAASTHGLNTTSLQVEYYVVYGAVKRFVYPDIVTITSTAVEATFSESLTNVYAIISRASGEFAQNVNSGATTTTSFFDIDTQYPITQAWLINPDGSREKAQVDSVELDQANKQMRFTVQNSSTAISLIITWESGTVVTNTLTLGSPLDADLQVGPLVWGLNQNLAYDNSNSSNRTGWVNFIDGYRKEAQEYLVCGSDRELFKPNSSTSLTPLLNLSLRGRCLLEGANQPVGPAFIGLTSPTPTYSNYVVGAGGESGWLRANSGTFVAGVTPKYSVQISATSYTGSLVGQYATVQKASAGLLNGVWKILNASFSSGTLTLGLETPQIVNEDWDGATCLIGIFSASVTLADAKKTFLTDDEVNSLYTVKRVTDTGLILDGFTQYETLIAGTLIYLTSREANALVPLRTTDGTDDEALGTATASLLVGDSILIGSNIQQYEIVDMVDAASADLTVAASVASGVSSAITEVLRQGQKVLLTGDYSGVVTIASLTSTTITFEEEVEGDCFLLGKTVELTRPVATFDTQVGGTGVTLQPRWAPLSRPDAADLPFSNASTFGLSSMSNDSLYVVSPEVTSPPLKWDGVELTRAGVPRWPLTAFITLEANGAVGPDPIVLSVSGWASNYFTLTSADDKNKLSVGTVVKNPVDGAVYTIQGYETVGANVRCYVNIAITGSTGSQNLSKVLVVNYYYRIKKTDSNGFETVGAVYGSQELNIRLDALTNIWHKVILPPTLKFTNKERYELEVYRTKGDASAPYYLTNRIRISPTDKYLTFVDKNPDINLEERDNISTSLLGSEVGVSWEDLPQGNSFTTAGNRSIVANIRSRPQLELQFNSIANTDAIANMDLTIITVGSLTYEFTDTASATTITGWTYNNANGVATITTSGTALTTGQKVYIGAVATATTRYPYLAGWYTMLSATTIQLEAGLGSPTLTDFPPDVFVASNANYVPVFIGTDFNHASLGTEKDYSWYESIRRLAMAIRATSDITAEAGDSFDNGYLKLQSDTPFDVTLTPKSAFVSSFKYAVGGQNIPMTADVAATSSAVQELFPSRLVYSYPNYPEVLDACFVASDLDSDNVIDVNASDGQEITAIQPFFGDSSFGQGSKEGVILVLKTNSAYVVDLNAKKEGRNAVQKLDTQGLGCEYPRSLSPIRNGLQFANRAGVWKITQDLRFMFAGRKLSNLWEQDLLGLIVATDIPCAHNSRLDSRWRLILDGPSGDGVSYNHLREYLPDGYRDGSWMQLASYPGLGFANLSSASFMASDKNRVALLLTSAYEEPFYDAGEAIYSEAILAAQDFGDATRRKSVQSFQLVLRTESDLKGLEVSTATEMRDAYVDADSLSVTVVKPTGLSDQPSERIQAFLFNSMNKRGTYFQLRLVHQAADEAPEILAVSYKVAGLTDKGVTDAKQSK